MDEDTTDLLHDTVKEIMDSATRPEALQKVAEHSINVFYQLYVEPDNDNPNINSIYVSSFQRL